MNDPELPEEHGLPELSAAEEARIRALLAAAKHEEPMPEAVVARLDRVLAGLAEEPLEPPLPANVARLAERRRRATRMLVAAAAVVVLGVGIGQVVKGSGGSSDSLNAGSAAAPERSDSLDREGSGQDSSAGGAASGHVTEPQPQKNGLKGLSAFKVRPQHFAQDSRRVRSRAFGTTDSVSNGYNGACVRGHWGAGRYVPVEYGRTPAFLVLRRNTGDSQVVDLFLCGSDEPARSVTLPGP